MLPRGPCTPRLLLQRDFYGSRALRALQRSDLAHAETFRWRLDSTRHSFGSSLQSALGFASPSQSSVPSSSPSWWYFRSLSGRYRVSAALSQPPCRLELASSLPLV